MSDPHFANVSLLVHLNGTDGAKTAPDVGPLEHGNGTFGTASEIDTAQSKFGGASLLVATNANTQGFLEYANHASFLFGDGEFTVEGFVRPSAFSLTNFLNLASVYNAATNQRSWRFGYNNNSLIMWHSTNGTNGTETVFGAHGMSVDTWYHLALARDSDGDVRAFVNGTQIGSAASITDSFHASNADLRIGNQDGTVSTTNVHGHIDEVRITKGVARYTGNFSPPTAEFPESAEEEPLSLSASFVDEGALSATVSKIVHPSASFSDDGALSATPTFISPEPPPPERTPPVQTVVIIAGI